MRILILGLVIYPTLIFAGSSNNRFQSFWQDFWTGLKNTISIIKDGNDIPSIGNPDCGQEGQPACIGDIEYWETGWKGCDYGLKKVWNWKNGRSYCYNDTRRSAEIPNWLIKTTKFQRELLKHRPLPRNIFLGAHNTQAPSKTTSFVKSGFGTLVINQIYSITDLLNMGVRSLSVDVHYVNRTFRVCHGNEDHWGCGIRSRFFASWLEELKIWLEKPENKDEIVHIHLETLVDNKLAEMFKTIKYFLGSYLDFIPEDMSRNSFNYDDAKTYISNGERIILQVENQGSGNIGSFNDQGLRVYKNYVASPGYPGHLIKQFRPGSCEINHQGGFPDLPNVKSSRTLLWLSEQDSAIISMDNIINKIYERFKKNDSSDNKISFSELRQATNCYFTLISLDKITPSKIFPTIWSWDLGEPIEWGLGRNCTVLKENGRWKSEDCAQKHKFVCINQFDNYDFQITPTSDIWENGQNICKSSFGDSYSFAMPLDPFQNDKIQKLSDQQVVWLNYASPGIYPKDIDDSSSNNEWEYTVRPVVSGKYMTEMHDNSVRQFGYIDNDQGRDNQIWKFIKEKDSELFTIVNKSTQKCLHAEGPPSIGNLGDVNYDEVLTSDCTDWTYQRWHIRYRGDGNYQIISDPLNMCLEVGGEDAFKSKDLTPFMLLPCEDVEDHYFKMEAP